MNSNKGMFFLILSLALPSVSKADAISDLVALVAKTKSVMGNQGAIDFYNPDGVPFKTNMNNQLVELNMTASRLNDAFLSAINYDPAFVRSKAKKMLAPTAITFGSLKITLDGCDITAALFSQCQTTSCWDSSLPTPSATFSGTFGTKVYLNLSALNPATISGCTADQGQTKFFDVTHTDHRIYFEETIEGKGGSLNYQVLVYQKAAE